MARIYPFRAWRYNPAQVRLDTVVTQPYDKISPAMQQAYYQSSPYNVVRIVLGLPELFDAERGESVYGRAARDFHAWREKGILVKEKEPCVYAYAQRFHAPGSGQVKERRGFIALGKLHEYADQVVFRHEETLSKPKSDRLKLLEATRAHFGQIFMLYSDPARSVEKILYDGNGPADAEVTDEFGVLHRLWRISDPAVLRILISEMDDKKLIIADGHHRYETALEYAREHAPSSQAKTETSVNQLPQPPNPEAVAMMTFINMDSDGIVVLPTHRVVHSLAGFEPVRFAKAAGDFFMLEELGRADASAYVEKLKTAQGTAFVAVTAAGAWLMRAKPEAVAGALGGASDRQRRLDLVQLHTLLLERVLGLSAESVRDEAHLRYCREAADAVDQVRRGKADIAFLTNAVSLEQLKEIAFAGEVMPQKSTDFYPKLLSGLAIYALD